MFLSWSHVQNVRERARLKSFMNAIVNFVGAMATSSVRAIVQNVWVWAGLQEVRKDKSCRLIILFTLTIGGKSAHLFALTAPRTAANVLAFAAITMAGARRLITSRIQSRKARWFWPSRIWIIISLIQIHRIYAPCANLAICHTTRNIMHETPLKRDGNRWLTMDKWSCLNDEMGI